MFTDAHTHLNISPLYEDRPTHIQEFITKHGIWLSIIWTDYENSVKALDIVHQSSIQSPQFQLGATVWLHPECVLHHVQQGKERDQRLQESIDQIELLVKNNKKAVVAIGEIGTDLHREQYRPYHDQQQELFDAQCTIARRYNLPVVIHSRADFDGTVQVLQKYQDLTIYFHCWWYTCEEITKLTELLPDTFTRNGNGYIWFCGNITYPKAHDLRSSLSLCYELGISILIETDAPFLAAQAVRGQTNSPALISHTYEYISDYLQLPLDQLTSMIANNRGRLYSKVISSSTLPAW